MVELSSFVVAGILAARRGIRQFSQPRLSHAQEMDTEFAHWQVVITDLRCFPRVERERRLKFVSTLRTNMVGWMLIGLRTRLDTYVALLEGSIQEPEPDVVAPL
ncbi:hypothetical protein [Stenotrophomonas sp. SMYL89]|uniref:hypothetical protein n=1 Tax=Stenotrophomonas sp. SMYL89 TaxID=3076046 RepID=UPI002E79247D|nr:hypothetical protein [Stenotrophomonas sp. SMYL89]